MSLSETDWLLPLQDRIGYRFRDPTLLQRALTHSSQKHESGGAFSDNETLEFFGDAILSMLVTEQLLREHPHRREGELSRLRARLVRASALARRARSLELGSFLLLGRGEDRGGGRNEPLLADAFEALIAAVYLDGGLEATRTFVLRELEESLRQASEATEPVDFKSTLQVLSQKEMGSVPEYRVLSEEGPEHEKRFLVEVRIGDQHRSEGWGRSKKLAEQEAARLCWTELQTRPAPVAG